MTPRYIENLSSDTVELEVYECSCGFHIGIDSTYLEQVNDVTIECPSCKETLKMEGAE